MLEAMQTSFLPHEVFDRNIKNTVIFARFPHEETAPKAPTNGNLRSVVVLGLLSDDWTPGNLLKHL